MNLLSCLKSFVVIVDNKSFSIAAKKLYASPSKLSKEISWLENRLHVRLFNRTTRRLHLTDAGKILYQRAMKIIHEFDSLQELQFQLGESPQVTLNLFVSATPAIPHFTELSFQYMELHPNVSINLITGTESIAYDSQKADLTITFEKVKHPNVICEKLFSVKRNIYASPDYLKKHDEIKTVDDLSKHNCLINTSYGLQNNWMLGDKVIQVHGNFQSNSASVIKLAAVNGRGLLWAPPFTVKQEVTSGLLKRVLDKYTSNDINLYYIHLSYTNKSKEINGLVKFFQDNANNDTD